MKHIEKIFVWALLSVCPIIAFGLNIGNAAVWLESEEADSTVSWVDRAADGISVSTRAKDSIGVHAFNFRPSLRVSPDDSISFVVSQFGLERMTVLGVVAPDTSLYGKEYSLLTVIRDDTLRITSSGVFRNDDQALPFASSSFERFTKEKPIGVFTVVVADDRSSSVWGDTPVRVHVGSTLRDSDSISPFEGYFPELLVFDRVLTPLECRQIESQMALRHGFTLDGSYIDLDGNLLWNADANANYSYRVFGVGKDGLGGMFQDRSTSSECDSTRSSLFYSSCADSIEPCALAPFRLISLERRNAAADGDGDYIVAGDDDGSLYNEVCKEQRLWRIMGRTWMAETNFRDTMKGENGGNRIEISYDRMNPSTERDSSRMVMVIDPDGEGDFTSTHLKMVRATTFDTIRRTLAFDGFVFDEDESGTDLFTFGWHDGVLANFRPHSETRTINGYSKDGKIDIGIVVGNNNFKYELLADSVKGLEKGDTVSSGYFSGRDIMIDSLSHGRYQLTVEQRCECDTTLTDLTTGGFFICTDSIIPNCTKDAFRRIVSVGLENEPTCPDSVEGCFLFLRPIVVDDVKDVPTAEETPWITVTDMGGGNFFLKFDTQMGGPASILLYDVQGRLTKVFEQPDCRPLLFSVSNKGIYMVKVITYDREYTQRIITR